MNWTNFISYLGIAYIIYYALNLSTDLWLKKSELSQSNLQNQSFQVIDLQEPVDSSELIEAGEVIGDHTGLQSGPLSATGELDFDGLMAAARSESIECIKKIAY